ncbi:hypothetical protein ACVJDU_001037 [Bradyrhizobium diazoefficiens]
MNFGSAAPARSTCCIFFTSSKALREAVYCASLPRANSALSADARVFSRTLTTLVWKIDATFSTSFGLLAATWSLIALM